MTITNADATLISAAPAAPIAAVDKTLVKPDTTTAIQAPAAAAVQPMPQAKSQTPLVAVIVGLTVIVLGAGAWFTYQRQASERASAGQGAPSQPGISTAPSSAPTTAPAAGTTAPATVTAAPKSDPGTVLISAVGLIDPNDPRYQSDKALLQSDLRADSKSQLVEKALGLLLDSKSLAKNYDVLKDKLLSRSGSYVMTVVRESEPRMGKDGLMSITTQAVVNVKAVQKSLNQMSRDERIELIRANGNPKVSVQISVRDADQPYAPPQTSPVAENILKERIKSFGFRTWSEGESGPEKGADFQVLGEAKIKKLSARLEASGLTVTKYALTSWTVKCIDRETGEEIYYNTTLPKGVGSWASEEEALKAIGTTIADEFSRDFFLQHVSVSGQKVTLVVEGMPDAASEDLLARELVGLPQVITATPRSPASPRSYDLQLAGSGAVGDLVSMGVLKPLNAKLGLTCFSLGSIAGDQVSVVFDKRCADASVLSRLETNPPAGLYGAPAGRQKTVVKNPETLRKLMI
jgi:serine/threonine-protein kinase